MRLEMLPCEQWDEEVVYAAVNENNEVVWTYGNPVDKETGLMEAALRDDRNMFTVCRRGKIVVVEAVGWWDSEFHFRMELTDDPYKVVILAHEAAALMEQARE